MTFTTIDIESRQRRGQECEQLLLQLEYVLDSINDGLVISDLEGNVLAMNKVALALHGFDSNREVRRHLSEYREMFELRDLEGRALPFEEWPLMRVYDGEEFHDYEVLTHRKGGKRVWVGSYSGAPVRNKTGEIILSVITVRDITLKIGTEEALGIATANMREFTSAMPVRVIRCSKDRRYLWVSEEYAQWLGRPSQEIVGRSLPEIIGEEALEAITPYLERVLAGQRVTYETRINYLGIGARWVTATYMPTYDAAGGVDGWFGVVFDITDRKDLEEKLQRANETLEQRIGQAVEELRQKDELLLIQSRQAVMAETINNLAHQWRQPLNTLALLAQEMQMTCRTGGGSQEYLEANIRKSLDTIMNLSKTIDDFRYFLKPCSEAEEFEAHEVLNKTLSLLRGSLSSQNIRTEVEITGNPIVKGCPSQFSQVLLNILSNAREAFATREVPDPLVAIRVYNVAGKTVLTVTDNAGGIPDQVIAKVFEPYFTTKDSNSGKGIGLFMCKTIIDKSMNGTISVRNVGSGAEVRIEL
jgi:two-component system, NtrC family, C4-dicarboxylate transport sensor histidine kinase DctB